jgi:EAL domain-containing protein (putative c-di-GMP-specific phosphodiesterase class I)/FixJ family two-component response regulator
MTQSVSSPAGSGLTNAGPSVERVRKAQGSLPRIATGHVRRPHILLLDDDPIMMEIQRRMLQNLGYSQLATASSAKEALLQLEHDPGSAELIVCDLDMPDVDGIEFLQNLSASPFRGSVILLSGVSARVMHTVQKLLGDTKLTILGALTKPASRDAIRALLECWRPPVAESAKKKGLLFSVEELYAANRDRQWVVHYQPQISLRNAELVGMEALVRWNHPVHGLVYPDSFIPQAEACGAIQGLTKRVMQQALAQQVHWRCGGINVQVAVNISMECLQAPEFWRQLGSLVRNASVAPSDVCLEITETQLMSSSPTPLENLVRLRMQQFALSIDDFGVGHSSLAQLRDVPFTELKVDRGFVSGARHNQIIRPILEGSIGIAKRMDMKSVAEGVETEDDWRLVRELGCDVAQGYFIARPMTGDRVEDWLNDWASRSRQLVAG